MAITAPLQLLLFLHAKDLDVLPYEQAIVRAFQGGMEAGGYLATGEDLGIQLEVFSSAPGLSVTEAVGSFCHTLTVVLVDSTLLEKADDAMWDWLAECWVFTNASDGRHAMLVLPMDERVGHQFLAKRSQFGTLQLQQVYDLGERAIRPAMLALRLLHECRILLASALTPASNCKAGFLRLFISHTKMDGLPLAHALKHQIEALRWLQDFYDVDDLPAGSDWQKELERGVGSSLPLRRLSVHPPGDH
jgi:hypothetical protein